MPPLEKKCIPIPMWMCAISFAIAHTIDLGVVVRRLHGQSMNEPSVIESKR
jgi:hypothetical protein